MKMISLVLAILLFLPDFVCSQVPPAEVDFQVTLEPIRVSYPAHRIDDQLKKISIIGNGPGSERFQPLLTRLFIGKSEIKILEAANLQSIFAGKPIEYGTAITPEQSQGLLRVFQLDHLLIFNVSAGTSAAYRNGGRAFTGIDLKIVDIRNGEILFRTSSNVGFRSKIALPPPFVGLLLFPMDPIIYELTYALGDVALGLRNESIMSNKILDVMVDSAAYRAGLQKGDTITGAGTKNVSTDIFTQLDVEKFLRSNKIQQGDGVIFRIIRNGNTLEQKVKFPLIPFSERK